MKVVDVVPPEVHAHFEIVAALVDRKVIDDLPLLHISSLRKEDTEREKPSDGPEARHGGVGRAQDFGKGLVCETQIRGLEDRGIAQVGKYEIVRHGRAEDMGVIQLAFILRLVADGIESRVNWVSIRRLRATVELHASKDLVVVIKGIIDSADKQPFLVAARTGQCDGAEARSRAAR